VLDISPNRYNLRRVGGGSGPIEVRGDRITFLPSSLCDGRGTYQWTISGEELTLTMVEKDQCPGRSDSLDDMVFHR